MSEEKRWLGKVFGIGIGIHKGQVIVEKRHCPLCLYADGVISKEQLEALKQPDGSYKSYVADISNCDCCSCLIEE